MDGPLDCDVVAFKAPHHECSLFVTNVPIDVDEVELWNVFGTCGLLNDVHIFNPESFKRKADSVPTTCVSVKYYTKAAVRKASAELNHYMFNGIPCKISPSKPTREVKNELSFPKTVDVCNHFLGFNQWSTKIVSMTKMEHSTEGLEEGQIRCEFECEVQVSLKDGRAANGLGVGKYTGKYAANVYEVARKTALTNARKNAFSKVVIMILTNGKVDVHVMEEKKEEVVVDENLNILTSLNIPVLVP